MANYRRSFITGASYFFTVNLAERSSRLLIEHIDWLREAIRYTRARHPFEIDAVVEGKEGKGKERAALTHVLGAPWKTDG